MSSFDPLDLYVHLIVFMSSEFRVNLFFLLVATWVYLKRVTVQLRVLKVRAGDNTVHFVVPLLFHLTSYYVYYDMPFFDNV